MKIFNQYFTFLVFSIAITACDNSTKTEKVVLSDSNSTKEATQVKTDSTTTALKFDHQYDDISSFISGIIPDKPEETGNYDSTLRWQKFAETFDSTWLKLNEDRFSKMKTWREEELTTVNKENKNLFYPFSGPDFLNADLFFPQADTLRLIGLEPIGQLPNIKSMSKQGVDSYLNSINNSLNDLFKKSYFITFNMRSHLGEDQVNGTLPILCIFLKRSIHTILNIEYIGVDSSGTIVSREDTASFNGTKGVKIEYISENSNAKKALYYFKTDLSDSGLKHNKGFTKYLNSMDTQITYLKAASHLLHYKTFSTIRTIILDKSNAILQDDSGISYKYFDKNTWNVKLYGNYRKAVKDFTGVDQPDLKKAYEADSTIKSVPFSLGYHWGSDEINLQLATKKK